MSSYLLLFCVQDRCENLKSVVFRDIQAVENRIKVFSILLTVHFRDPLMTFCQNVCSGALAHAMADFQVNNALFAEIDLYMKLSACFHNILKMKKSLMVYFKRFLAIKNSLINFEINVEKTRDILQKLRAFDDFKNRLETCEAECKFFSGMDHIEKYLNTISSRFLYYKQILHKASMGFSKLYDKQELSF